MKKADILPTQPIFGNLISGCLKTRQLEKAWKTFDEMRLSYYQPDEVTFTMMLHACARVNLLHQMEDVHGFRPDLITYNTLLGACARKKDLENARNIFRHLIQTNHPDHRSFTNLFWCYANYDPPTTNNKNYKVIESPSPTTLPVADNIDLLIPKDLPTRRSAVVREAMSVFNYMIQQQETPIEMTPSLLTAYLNTHVTQLQTEHCLHIFDTLFPTYNIAPNASTYKVMLRHCYQTKDTDLAWRIWDDYQAFLETRALPSTYNDMTMIEQKKIKLERQTQQVMEGWTLDQQRSMVITMATVLAR
ncbi:hypothetical protein BC941DRAFT_342474 [Chlamydoabsidia padenii]|nr:hypothetical protein BC941DRAFT_342474 [Chlamydoabsidia padenii]